MDVFSNHGVYTEGRKFPKSTMMDTSEEGNRLEESSKKKFFVFPLFFNKSVFLGNFLAVQCLGLHDFTAMGPGLIDLEMIQYGKSERHDVPKCLYAR